MTLKEKLLESNLVIDNEYLDKYINLIEINKNTKKEKFKTQQHHIIPKFYYKLNNLSLDNSKNNLVNLLYKDHLLAHILLSLCSKKEIYSYYNFISIQYISNKFNLNNLDNYQKEYELSRQLSSKYNVMYNEQTKQNHLKAMQSDKVRNKISKTMSELRNTVGFSEDHKKHISESQKDMIYIYNNEKITRIHEKDLEEFLNKGWKIYEKRSYDQLCGRQPMTIKTEYHNMFASRNISCYCIINGNKKIEFRSIRDATVWWFENFHPFGNKYSGSTLTRNIKKSINNKVIEFGIPGQKNYIKIDNIKWYKN